ncbi:NAD(P)/FAD-dependent oxidoreductase [Flavobacteriaceae bacterium S356]|uniref:NAD(P)/FAD-dependent oxidoreductase n=1 Tax=Asprobacillus argus TaxID=3076534 RepID=A0ABU3LHX6_9FLAO|nr:NAD(P)/FAD-dependent oxidoreductase [Flavobacteriaceae bacterium S356]
MNTFDVVIVGGGTAGLILARELGKAKRKILVLDRRSNLLDFSFNTLGSFINLKDFDLTENVVAQKIDRVTFRSKLMVRKVNVDAYILDKKKVHEELLDAIDNAYVTTLLNVNIKGINKDEQGQFTSVTDSKGNEYFGKIFIDATGTNGVISKKVGLRDPKVDLGTGVEYNVKYTGDPKEGHLLIGKVYQGGYGWIFPLKDNRAIIGFGTFDEKVVKELKHRLNEILKLPHIKKLVVKDNEKVEGGSIPITPVLDKFVLHNLVCVGDSVSQVNPIVGEGYKFIFEAGLMASKAIDKSLENDNLDCLLEYESDWRKRFLANYSRSKRSQERLFRHSNKDLLMDFALFLTKFRSDRKIVRSLSGEYGLEET